MNANCLILSCLCFLMFLFDFYLGYSYYTFVKSHPDHDDKTGNFVYYLTDDSVATCGLLKEASRDPLKSIASCYLKIVNGEIKGIIVEDDWVEMI